MGEYGMAMQLELKRVLAWAWRMLPAIKMGNCSPVDLLCFQHCVFHAQTHRSTKHAQMRSVGRWARRKLYLMCEGTICVKSFNDYQVNYHTKKKWLLRCEMMSLVSINFSIGINSIVIYNKFNNIWYLCIENVEYWIKCKYWTKKFIVYDGLISYRMEHFFENMTQWNENNENSTFTIK